MGMREWHPEQGFPTAKQMARMVAAEVRAQVETAMQRERDKAEKVERRRERLRDVYRRHTGASGKDVDSDSAWQLVEGIAEATFAAWRGLAEIDHIALAEAGTREEFDDLEFLVNRGLCELNGVRSVVTLARRLA